MHRFHPALVAASAAVLSASPVLAQLSLEVVGRYDSGVFDGSAAEIPAYDPTSQRLFVTNADADTLDVLDISNPAMPTLVTSLNFAGSPNSVAIMNGVGVVALEDAADVTLPGTITFFDPGTLGIGNTVGVGALPDMVTFNRDGTKILVANEGQPNDAYTFDPEGSISIIDVATQNVTTAGFGTFNAQQAALEAAGVRIFGPGASVAQDLEPEYITVSPDNTTAFVSLQENNAFATVDIASGTVTAVTSFGTKDHAQLQNAFDPSNRDGGINFVTADVKGLYQPDAIASYEVGGQTFIVTANEGDARDYGGFSEEVRVGDVVLDPVLYSDAATLQLDENLGRLRTTTATGDLDGDGDVDQIFSYGGRSFSIFDANGNQVFDSGDDFERLTASFLAEDFNSNNDDNDSFDARSDDKGPEPEGVTLGVIDGRTYAFIGLERVGGLMVYDITDPTAASFVDYLNNRDFDVDAEVGGMSNPLAGDLGPEGLLFIDAVDSPTSNPLLIVTNEVSGTTTIYSVPEPATLGLLAAAGTLLLRRRA